MPQTTEIRLHNTLSNQIEPFVPQKPGRYALTCADHDWAGMIGEITIE